MSTHDDLRRATETARARRAHLSTRALLDLVMRLGRRVERAAARLRHRLDPSGGAEDPGLRGDAASPPG